ncbi:MAG: hypothetical protein HQM07_04855, partial [Zetaproteobacteria bacterium]|nr:hypothetical protein [Zetaproteobacteria bacterium]
GNGLGHVIDIVANPDNVLKSSSNKALESVKGAVEPVGATLSAVIAKAGSMVSNKK